MNPRSTLLATLVFAMDCFAWPSGMLAGGSIGWDEVQARVNKEDPPLMAFITEHLEFAPSGGAMRVGHDSKGRSTVPGLEVGTRLPPYEFRAKPKGAEGGYTLFVTLEQVSFDGGKTFSWQISLRQKRPAE